MTEKTSDLNRFIELYKIVGIPLRLYWYSDRETLCLVLKQGANNKFTGDAGYGSTIKFDAHGKFIEQSFSEGK